MTGSLFPSTRSARMLEIGMVFYLTIYAFEGPVRYALYNAGLDDYIVARDAVLALVLIPAFFSPSIGATSRVYLYWFVAIIGLHSVIILLNFDAPLVLGYTAKEFMPILFGVVLGRLTGRPSRFVIYSFTILWAITVFGLLLDKFVLTFPWTGLETEVGGFKVDVGKDWYATGLEKRVGGFTRSSIHAALILPLLSMMLLANVQRWSARFAIVAVTCGCVFLTTQKGSLIGYLIVSVCFLMSYAATRSALKCSFVVGLLLTFSLPPLLSGVILPSGGGVFSLSSFALRTASVWPDAFRWIDHNQIFPFGVGLGGIGGAQRLYAMSQLNNADNMFLFLYGSFGVMAFVYVAYVGYLCLSPSRRADAFDIFPRAVLAFHFTYGTVLSIIEDQSSCIILGLSLGYLLYGRKVEAESAAFSQPVSAPRGRGWSAKTMRPDDALPAGS